jgi:putative acetyltransferase
MTVRPAKLSDAIAIADLHAESWRSTYPGILRDEFLDGAVIQDRRRLWETRLSSSPEPETQLVRIVEHRGRLTAFVCAFLDADPEWGALLDNLHVSPSSKGQGLGRRLMAEVARWVLQHRPDSRLHLWVYEKNVPARRFYEHLGGVVTGRHAHLAPDGSYVEAVRYGWEDLLGLLPRVGMTIRDETPADFDAIRQVNSAAFSSDLEAGLIERLRDEGIIIRSLVAVADAQLVGHILFSQVWVENDKEMVTVASLAPMAVHPDHQRRGIGSALVRDGIEVCRQDGWHAIIVVGHPGYYPRFGFSSQVAAHLKSPYAGAAFMGLELKPGALTSLQGQVRYPKAFDMFA